MREFFTENDGRLSWTRLAGTVCLLVSLFMAVLITIKVFNSEPMIIGETVIPPDIAYIAPMTFLILGILGFAFGAKVSQKWAEKSGEIDTNKP